MTAPLLKLKPWQMVCICLLSLVATGRMSGQIPGSLATYSMKDFGAKGDGSFDNTVPIQNAVNACAENGGGTVYFPPGVYLSSTIELKSNVTIYLENGATVKAIPDLKLYKNAKEGLEDAGASFIPALFLAKKVHHIGFSGKGTIEGLPNIITKEVTWNDSWPGWNENARKSGVEMKTFVLDDPKVSLVYISEAEHVSLSDITILNSPFWACHIQWSSYVKINGITIRSSLEKGVNSDGLDIDGSKNVTVSNCQIYTGDDAICLKTTLQNGRTQSCEDITITNCITSSSSCALKLGTESYSDFRNIIFSNCVVKASNRGLGIFIRDGGTAENIIFSNIIIHCNRKPFFWWGDGDAFQFVVLKRNEKSKTGKIRNVVVKDVFASAEGTSLIKGFPGSIAHITLSNINIDMNPESQTDKRATYGIEINTVSDLAIENLDLRWNKENYENKWINGLALINVDGYTIGRYKNAPAPVNKKLSPVLKINSREKD